MTDKPQHYYEHYEKQCRDDEATVKLADEDATGLLADDEATGLLVQADDEATGLLKAEDVRTHYASIRRMATDETFLLDKPAFRIGKDKSLSDYCVADNNMVSRSHADVISRNGRYFIVDLVSKNGTFVNGAPVPPQQEREIRDGDAIRLANEEFEFHI